MFLQAADFLGDSDGVCAMSEILGKQLLSPAAHPTTERLLSCMNELKQAPRAVEVRVSATSDLPTDRNVMLHCSEQQ
jgi:hypothetical protein